MVVKIWTEREDSVFYAYDPEHPGNFGVGCQENTATRSFEERQRLKSEILADLNNYEIFPAHLRDYYAGLISRNYSEIQKIQLKMMGEIV